MKYELSNILPDSTVIDFSQYLSVRSTPVKNTINECGYGYDKTLVKTVCVM